MRTSLTYFAMKSRDYIGSRASNSKLEFGIFNKQH